MRSVEGAGGEAVYEADDEASGQVDISGVREEDRGEHRWARHQDNHERKDHTGYSHEYR